MDPSAVNVNVTVDDFDSVLSYADQSVWSTPDPSSSSFDDTNSPWLKGTFHETNSVGATISFNFTGPAIFVYGHAGPSYGSFKVRIDGTSTTLSAHAANNASTPHLLYGTSNLTYADHTLVLTNLGATENDNGASKFLLDYIQATIQVAPAGATVSNTTYEENNSALTYTGAWGNNTGPVFSGGGTAFTHEDNASVTLSFKGSAIYVFGDKKNDHGFYKVTLDDAPPEIFNGISGCGGAFGMTCEQQKPTLQYVKSNLDDSMHTITVVNLAGVNNSFLDIDSFVTTVPSVYDVRNLTEGSPSSSASGTSAAPGATNSPNINAAVSIFTSSSYFNTLLLVLPLYWLMRKVASS